MTPDEKKSTAPSQCAFCKDDVPCPDHIADAVKESQPPAPSREEIFWMALEHVMHGVSIPKGQRQHGKGSGWQIDAHLAIKARDFDALRQVLHLDRAPWHRRKS